MAGDMSAIDAALKIIEQRCRLLGLGQGGEYTPAGDDGRVEAELGHVHAEELPPGVVGDLAPSWSRPAGGGKTAGVVPGWHVR